MNDMSTAHTWALPARIDAAEAATVILSFLDTASTSMGRATAYNDRAAQQAAELAAHQNLVALDRGLYALLLQLPGVTDRARQIGVKNLLGIPGAGDGMLDAKLEALALRRMVDELPATRLLKMFVALRVGNQAEGIRKANNARTRKLILRVLLGSPKLELWAVKYRRKVADALTHAWGRQMASVIGTLLEKEAWTPKEQSIVQDMIDRHAATPAVARECVSFVLGRRRPWRLPLLVAYERAKIDLSAGAKLPPEVLEGLRSTFHKDVPKEEVLRLTAAHLTEGQKLAVQKRANEAGIEIVFDPRAHDLVRLYLYAYQMGMTDAVASAIADKARAIGTTLRLPYARVGIVLDASRSMAGSKEQPLRPMATALALRDVLSHGAEAEVFVAGGSGGRLPRPQGATALAGALLDAVAASPQAIFVISDGYENSPAGRFADVVASLRAMGIEVPIFHFNPVFAAESGGVRSLGVPTMPAASPEALGLSFVRGLLEADPRRGLAAIVGLAAPRLVA